MDYPGMVTYKDCAIYGTSQQHDYVMALAAAS